MSAGSSASSSLERAGERVKRGLGHAWTLLTEAIDGISRHRGTQLAASMSYYALFSVFPAAIVAAAAAGFFLDDPGARDDAVQYLLDELPLTAEQGRADLEKTIDASNAGTVGLVGVLGLLITASALMSATRNSINAIFGDGVRRGALRGKGLDVLLVVGLGLLFSLSFAGTVITQLDIKLGGGIGDLIESILNASGALLPIALAVIVFSVLLTVLPVHRRRLADVWPGVIFAALGYELLKRGFGIYLDQFANYSAVYGSLGAVIAFMFFVWLASLVFLIGAEMAAVWPKVRAGAFDADPDEQDERNIGEKARDAVLGLFRRNRVESSPRRSHDP
jgi:membrane protein